MPQGRITRHPSCAALPVTAALTQSRYSILSECPYNVALGMPQGQVVYYSVSPGKSAWSG